MLARMQQIDVATGLLQALVRAQASRHVISIATVALFRVLVGEGNPDVCMHMCMQMCKQAVMGGTE